MKSHADKIILKRAGGRVTRGHTNDTTKQQSNGEHTYNMECLIDDLHPNPSAELYKAIRNHDVAEAITGDVPSTAKRRWPSIKQMLNDAEEELVKEWGLAVKITEDDLKWLKAVDKLEYFLYCQEEVARGNSSAKIRGESTKRKMLESNDTPPEIRDYLMNYQHKHIDEVINERI